MEAVVAKEIISSQTPPKGADNHPQKKGAVFVTDRDGTDIGFRWANGQCSDVCDNGRTHCCQLCLGSHRNADCTSKPKGGGKKGKGKHGRK